MMLMTKEQRQKLLRNGQATVAAIEASDDTPAHPPVVKLFTPWGAATWLISELDPEDEDRAFGLADLGFGTPELGWMYLPEMREIQGPFGLKIERDLYFDADGKAIGTYADEARSLGYIKA